MYITYGGSGVQSASKPPLEVGIENRLKDCMEYRSRFRCQFRIWFKLWFETGLYYTFHILPWYMPYS